MKKFYIVRTYMAREGFEIEAKDLAEATHMIEENADLGERTFDEYDEVLVTDIYDDPDAPKPLASM